MKVQKIFESISGCLFKGSQEVIISGISANSKEIMVGNLFIAKKGLMHDGGKYSVEAVERGAVAILTASYLPHVKEITQIIHAEPEKIESQVVAAYYQNPADELFLVGITGTNGKTTTSLIIKYLLEIFSGSTGVIGTIAYWIGSRYLEATRTTPDVATNHRLLREMVNQGCQSAVMEVTSHALMQGRVDKIEYDVALFTQLTPDHLDYHGTMENYCAAKSQLFKNLGKAKGNKQKIKWAVVNQDCEWVEKIIEECSASILTYGIDQPADLRATQIQLSDNGTFLNVSYGNQTCSCFWPLIGKFNVYNCLAAIGVLLTKGFSLKAITEKLTHLPHVSARLERVENELGLKIYIDYAHTEDALKNVLLTLNEVKKGKLITVFGCGGDRDKTKRPKMAKVCEALSDFSIVTTDNPRSEDPEAICGEIASGFSENSQFVIEVDRYLAIKKAIQEASKDDLILIAGKGHETYQIFAQHIVEFNDYQIALKICSEIAQAKGKLCRL